MHADRFAVLAQQPVQDRASGQASLLEAPAAGWLIHCVREARQTAAACGEDLVLVATTLAHCTATTFLMMLMLDGRMHAWLRGEARHRALISALTQRPAGGGGGGSRWQVTDRLEGGRVGGHCWPLPPS
jgi:hypothetical protein